MIDNNTSDISISKTSSFEFDTTYGTLYLPIRSKVFGLSFNNDEFESDEDKRQFLKTLKKGDILDLIPNPDNKYDSDAIGIYAPLYSDVLEDGRYYPITNKRIGFIQQKRTNLASQLTELFTYLNDNNFEYTPSCKILDITGIDKPNIGINIEINVEIERK